MKYAKVVKAEFLSRPNRFLAKVMLNGSVETVHVKNTGRCRELLQPGSAVWLAESDNPARKTRYDLVTVAKKRPGKADLMVNMDSQAPNAAAQEWLQSGTYFSPEAKVRRETVHGDSRFDFYIEDRGRKAFLEVKGVTLEEDGLAAFPDAPTERGIKHIEGLIRCLDEGFDAYLLFVLQMKEIRALCPNDRTHKAFGDALRRAHKAGVKILVYDCRVSPDTMVIDSPIELLLRQPGPASKEDRK